MRTILIMLTVLATGGSLARAQASDTQAQTLDQDRKAYVISNTDRLRVAVYQEDDLSILARVDSKGNINLPLVGEVYVMGKTIQQAEDAVEKAYVDGRFLRNPKVTINVEEYAPREVSITGQVRSPGRYVIPPESSMSILELITKAGGFTDIAKGSQVIVTRILPNGDKKNFEIDVESLIKGKGDASVKDNSLLLEPGDLVYVKERII